MDSDFEKTSLNRLLTGVALTWTEAPRWLRPGFLTSEAIVSHMLDVEIALSWTYFSLKSQQMLGALLPQLSPYQRQPVGSASSATK